MTTSVACKTLHVSPPSGQYVSDQVSVVVSQNGCISDEQDQVVTSEFSLMEMTEVEYTHLQHIIQSHLEAQVMEQNGSEEVRLNPAAYTIGSPSIHTQTDGVITVGSRPSSPPVCQPEDVIPTTSSDVQYAVSKPVQIDPQEIKMVLVSDPSSSLIAGERTPTSWGEVPGSVLAKVRSAREVDRDGGVDMGEHRGASQVEVRPNPPARVRLEKRFNCSPRDTTRQQQESHSTALNVFLSMLHQSSEAQGIAMHSQSEKWMKSDWRTAAECPYPYRGTIFNTVGGTRGQGLGHLSQLLEGNKHSELIIPKNFTFNYRPEKDGGTVVKAPCIIRTGSVEEGVEMTANPGPLPKRARTRGLRAQTPNIIQGTGNWRGGLTGPTPKTSRRQGLALETSQRRERHNSKERDRRRRIRLCCDELNLLVPFCTTETDKATTLQWTTAFLKYIREVYGDSLKQDFQSTFCGKTGLRIKPSCVAKVTRSQSSEELGELQTATSQE
ncbi:transcription factor-like 5 protein [Chanos chanos]|uniref:Transcription factor-like 5 protein n=1 Tax=Chanos chanos TaxID=29144 RepID=A0A6J2UWF9_CHACN|nr:transcription factor-like 5 protein [Chanos chanos]